MVMSMLFRNLFRTSSFVLLEVDDYFKDTMTSLKIKRCHLEMAAIVRGTYHPLFLFEFRFCTSCSKHTPGWLFPPRGIQMNVSTPLS